MCVFATILRFTLNRVFVPILLINRNHQWRSTHAPFPCPPPSVPHLPPPWHTTDTPYHNALWGACLRRDGSLDGQGGGGHCGPVGAGWSRIVPLVDHTSTTVGPISDPPLDDPWPSCTFINWTTKIDTSS